MNFVFTLFGHQDVNLGESQTHQRGGGVLCSGVHGGGIEPPRIAPTDLKTVTLCVMANHKTTRSSMCTARSED